MKEYKVIEDGIEYKINEYSTGTIYWNLNNLYHRENGPAIECYNGYKAWYKYGKCHREDGPAVHYYNGYKAWWKHGKRHREDGPAIECLDSRKEYCLDSRKEYWLDGIPYLYIISDEEWVKLVPIISIII
jgi:hypothetical protein